MQENNIKKLCLATGHRWLESIDIDAKGSLYFTDSVEKALYRIQRNEDGTLSQRKEQKLLWKFEHAGGVSIDRVNNELYFGIRTKKKGKILKIPLVLFDEVGYQPNTFEKILEKHSPKIIAFDIKPPNDYPSPRPNGVIYDPNGNNVYYSHEGLLGLGKKAYVGTKNDPATPGRFHSANGLGIYTSNGESFLVIAQTLKNSIVRVNLSTKDSISVELHHEPKTKWGLFPDGVYCIKNGDVLFASFFYGRIYYMHWNGQSYDNPYIIAEDLNYPTDLVIGKSSDGKKEESMFVTTTKLGWAYLRGGSNIIEVPNIQDKINSAQK